MSNLTNIPRYNLISTEVPENALTAILSALPSAIASPFLEYQRTRAQKQSLMIAMEAKKVERMEILRTIRVLAQCGQLTKELSDVLLSAYYQAPILYPQ